MAWSTLPPRARHRASAGRAWRARSRTSRRQVRMAGFEWRRTARRLDRPRVPSASTFGWNARETWRRDGPRASPSPEAALPSRLHLTEYILSDLESRKAHWKGSRGGSATGPATHGVARWSPEAAPSVGSHALVASTSRAAACGTSSGLGGHRPERFAPRRRPSPHAAPRGRLPVASHPCQAPPIELRVAPSTAHRAAARRRIRSNRPSPSRRSARSSVGSSRART